MQGGHLNVFGPPAVGRRVTVGTGHLWEIWNLLGVDKDTSFIVKEGLFIVIDFFCEMKSYVGPFHSQGLDYMYMYVPMIPGNQIVNLV